MLKAADSGRITEKQQQALTELEIGGFATAWRLKEILCWITERHLCTGLPNGAAPPSTAIP
ncbi:hypothetical protein DFAR_830001 [Desulfarculales bacterium]